MDPNPQRVAQRIKEIGEAMANGGVPPDHTTFTAMAIMCVAAIETKDLHPKHRNSEIVLAAKALAQSVMTGKDHAVVETRVSQGDAEDLLDTLLWCPGCDGPSKKGLALVKRHPLTDAAEATKARDGDLAYCLGCGSLLIVENRQLRPWNPDAAYPELPERLNDVLKGVEKQPW